MMKKQRSNLRNLRVEKEQYATQCAHLCLLIYLQASSQDQKGNNIKYSIEYRIEWGRVRGWYLLDKRGYSIADNLKLDQCHLPRKHSNRFMHFNSVCNGLVSKEDERGKFIYDMWFAYLLWK